MTVKMEKMVEKLVSRFFGRSREEVVQGDVIDAVAYEKQFKKFNSEERVQIALEAILRLEGEEALDHAKEEMRDYYGDYFAIAL